jgi:hypothetical protein
VYIRRDSQEGIIDSLSHTARPDVETSSSLRNCLTQCVLILDGFACTKDNFRAHENLGVPIRTVALTVLLGKTGCVRELQFVCELRIQSGVEESKGLTKC